MHTAADGRADGQTDMLLAIAHLMLHALHAWHRWAKKLVLVVLPGLPPNLIGNVKLLPVFHFRLSEIEFLLGWFKPYHNPLDVVKI